MTNVRYLSGFTGSSGFLLIAKAGMAFATDFRYKEQAGKEVSGWDIVMEKNRMDTLKRLSRRFGLKCLRFEPAVPYEFWGRLKALGLELRPARAAVERLREKKDSLEMDSIKEAVRRAESAFLDVLPYIRTGASEISIALRLEEALKKKGSNLIPFGIIVASGPNSAMPHARATERRLAPGDLVVVDWGGEAGGYFSDMTRTLLVKGPMAGKKREIYGIVLEAQRKAISAVSCGVPAREIDNSARDIIKRAGYGSFFGHGVGHGVGLEVHERPGISGKARGRIEEAMVFTIEPGIYVPGLGGVRIEDMVVVRKKGAGLLTTLPRGLKIVSPK